MSADSAARHIAVGRNEAAPGRATTIVCTGPPQAGAYPANAELAVLREAPYRACLGVSRGQISAGAYSGFFKDYSSLLLLTAANQSLELLETHAPTPAHRATLVSLAARNAALELLCNHPKLFAVDSRQFDLCVRVEASRQTSHGANYP